MIAPRILAASLLVASPLLGQAVTRDPFPPLEAAEGVIRVGFREFARLPEIDSAPARMMMLLPEPGAQNVLVNDMRGPIYRISADGRSVTRYVDVNDATWGVHVQSRGRERGVQSFAFHPQFREQGTPGYGKFYTWSDVTTNTNEPDYRPGGGGNTHHTVLHEWTARAPGAATYDGEEPRELLRLEQPYANHNGGQIGFNPLARPGDPDFGLLYIGVGDGGSGGDPLTLAQNMASPFGKILRIDPLERNSTNRKYGIPADNPFVGQEGALGEIYAIGLRNPQRFAWDPANGAMYVSDIGQNIVEELSPVSKGANLGWNVWEGSYRYAGRQGVDTSNPRGDEAMTFPIAEYDHSDPILINRAASTGVVIVRDGTIPQLRNRILFGDMPSGEIFHVSADQVPDGGHDEIRRVLLNQDGQARTFLEVIRGVNASATRADLRFGTGPNGQIFLLNKADGVIRLLVP